MEKNDAGFDTPIGFFYAFREDVWKIDEVELGRVSVYLHGTNEWNELYFTPGTGAWSEVSGHGGSGSNWNQKSKITCLKETLFDWQQVNQLATRKVLVKLVFNSGTKLVGTIDRPVQLQVSSEDSQGMQTVISFERTSRVRAKWIL